MEIGSILDLDRYPLDRPDAPARVAALAAARRELADDGCAVVPALVRAEALSALCEEARTIAPAAHFSVARINPYFGTEPDPALPADHPANIFIERTSGFVPGDAFPPDSLIEAVYRWPPLLRFVAECLGIDELHCYADPLACLTLNVLQPGQQFSWHYDNNDFAVTVLLQEADEGGLFRYAPDIRSRADENAAGAAAVLRGDDTEVKNLDLRPGDLQIFRGRYSLHQVTRVGAGSRPRLTAVFAYTLEAGLIGGLVRTQQLFGRTLPIHHDYARGQAVRQDALLD